DFSNRDRPELGCVKMRVYQFSFTRRFDACRSRTGAARRLIRAQFLLIGRTAIARRCKARALMVNGRQPF
ncbi:MAG TPA: hypothetical protein VG270_09970, partial [Pseudolabrys sp.]|nr:hypothetical protein [Pseudolabrys sp.]